MSAIDRFHCISNVALPDFFYLNSAKSLAKLLCFLILYKAKIPNKRKIIKVWGYKTIKNFFFLKPTHFCILLMAFHWLLALLKRVEMSGFRQACEKSAHVGTKQFKARRHVDSKNTYRRKHVGT